MNHLLLLNQLNLSEGPAEMLADETRPVKARQKSMAPLLYEPRYYVTCAFCNNVVEEVWCLKIAIAQPVSGRGSRGSTFG